MSKQTVQLVLSIFFLTCFMGLLGGIFVVEVDDNMNMVQGENSLMGELTVLIGVMTGGVSMILNFWFNSDGKLPKDSMMEKFVGDASKRSKQINDNLSKERVERAKHGPPPAPATSPPAEEDCHWSLNPEELISSNLESTSSSISPPSNILGASPAPPNNPTHMTTENSPNSGGSSSLNLSPTPQLDEPEESVGQNGNNLGKDVILVQKYLNALGYLQDEAELNRVQHMPPNSSVPESELVQTIKAIKRMQLYGLGINNCDGRLDPRGNTLRHLMKRMGMVEQYKAYKIAKRDTSSVLSEDQWISQFDSVSAESKGRGLLESEKARPGKPNNVCCWDTAQAMVKLKVGNIKHNVAERIPTIFQGDTRDTWIMNEQAILGVKYIDREVEAGFPVFVGVDDGRTASYNADGTTEHYIVIVGKVVQGDKLSYRFFDPGSRHGHLKGYAATNLVTLEADHTLKGSKPGGGATYTVSQVRQNDR